MCLGFVELVVAMIVIVVCAATLEQAVNGNNARNVSLDVTGTGSVTLLTRMQLNDNKAGMQGLDKAHINQIIYAASKGNDFNLSFSK